MPQPVGFYTDTTVCIGCKACQVACHQWNDLPSGTGPTQPNGFRKSLPVLTGATLNGATTYIAGNFNSTAGTAFTLEFFYSPSCDPSGNGEGSSFIGSTTVAGGRPTLFQFQTSNIFLQGSFTATATTANGTSELSACLR